MGKKQKLKGKKVNPKKIAPAPKKRVEKKILSYKTGTMRMKKTMKTIPKSKK
jgi:hypothetical protein